MAESRLQKLFFPFSFCALVALLFSIKATMIIVFAAFAITMVSCFALGIYQVRSGRATFSAIPNGRKKIILLAFSVAVCILLVKNWILLNPRVFQEIPIANILTSRLPISQNSAWLLMLLASAFVGIMAFPVLFQTLCLMESVIWQPIKIWIRSLSKIERNVIIGFTLLIAVLAIITAIKNPIFFYTIENGNPTYVNIFGSDSSYLVYFDYMASPVLDDLRHPLMGIISLPFSLIAWCIALPAHIVTMFSFDLFLLYGIGFAIVQALIVAVSAVLLRQISKELLGERFSYLLMFLFLASFPAIFYSLIIERYAILMFYLMIFLYVWYTKKSFQTRLICFILAVGAIFTTSILFPLVFCNLQEFRKKIGRTVMIAVAVVLITGHLAMVLNCFSLSGGFLSKWASFGHPTAGQQYLSFVRSMLISPGFRFVEQNICMTEPGYVSLVTTISSSIIFTATALGIIFGIKKRLIQVSAAWVLFSILLLLLVGLGALANEMVLYSLYYNWAFVILIVYGIYKLFSKRESAGFGLLAITTAAVFAFNLYYWSQMIRL